MLEEDLPEGFKGAPQPKEKPYVTRQKIVLEEKGVNYWEVLPLDWMMVRHYSGMPVYMHRTTRVCTLARPYFLGKGNARRHDIPISAIPCLSYRKALEEERKQEAIDRKIEEHIKNGTWMINSINNKPKENEVNIKANDTDKIIENHDKTDNIVNDHTSTGGQVENNDKTLNLTDIDKTNSTSDENIPEDTCNNGLLLEKSTSKTETLAKCPSFNFNDQNAAGSNLESVCPVTGKNNSVINYVTVMDKSAQSEVTLGECNATDKYNNSIEECNAPDKGALSTGEPIAEMSETIEGNADAIEGNKEEGNETIDDVELLKYRQPVVMPGGVVMPAPKVETVNTSWKTQHLSHEQVNDYCKKLFKFKTINIMHFNRWADRRKYNKARKTLQYPTLPDGTKLITLPARPNGQDNGGKPVKHDWLMNMDGRSYLSVFHEYVHRALQKQPVYKFVQLENAVSPYQATVYIGGMQYGVGRGSSKRQAKAAAARASVHVLIPEMRDHERPPSSASASAPAEPAEPDFSFFDYVGIEDPRIAEFCAATCEPSPHAILRTCLLRNFGASDRHIHTEMKKLEFQKIELTMKVGKHTATVICKNKKTAKQRASQAILQALHPHVRSWGSLLRLYGSRSVKSSKEKKLEEQQITLLQDRARHNQPNQAVLDKLRRDMRRLRDRDAAIVPIGTLLLEDDLPTHSGSNLNNVDL
ncbi:unnamed protein product [Diatraea saccharalis]|nr:unnamed protein product [Diatraea saccharalis]